MLGLNEEIVGRMGDGRGRSLPGRVCTATNVRPTNKATAPYVRPARNLNVPMQQHTVSPVTTQQEGCLSRLYVNVPRLPSWLLLAPDQLYNCGNIEH
jgi:hypothetical protein